MFFIPFDLKETAFFLFALRFFLSRLEEALGGFEEKLLSKMAPLIFLCLCGIFQFANVEFCAILIVYVKFL